MREPGARVVQHGAAPGGVQPRVAAADRRLNAGLLGDRVVLQRCVERHGRAQVGVEPGGVDGRQVERGDTLGHAHEVI